MTKHFKECESKNHEECRGEIWQCEKCKKKTCYEEGGEQDNLCDDCHNAKIKKEMIPKKTKTTYKKIRTVAELREACNDFSYTDFFIALGGIRSSKEIMLSSSRKNSIFLINNCIDDSEQDLNEKQIMDARYTNIGEAMKKGNFYQVIY